MVERLLIMIRLPIRHYVDKVENTRHHIWECQMKENGNERGIEWFRPMLFDDWVNWGRCFVSFWKTGVFFAVVNLLAQHSSASKVLLPALQTSRSQDAPFLCQPGLAQDTYNCWGTKELANKYRKISIPSPTSDDQTLINVYERLWTFSSSVWPAS